MRLLKTLLCATALLSVSLVARADTYKFVFTGVASSGTTFTFDLNSTMVPSRHDTGAFYDDVTDTVNSSHYTVGFGDFADGDVFGIGSDTSLYVQDNVVGVGSTGNLLGFDFASSPFYTGPVSDPTFNLGTFSDSFGDKLVVTDLTPPNVTPEPSTVILLGTGILGLAGAARRRFLAA